jgi:hypothetical protein
VKRQEQQPTVPWRLMVLCSVSGALTLLVLLRIGRALWPGPIAPPPNAGVVEQIFDASPVVFGARLALLCLIPILASATVFVSASFVMRLFRRQWMSRFLWIEMSPEAVREHPELVEARRDVDSLRKVLRRTDKALTETERQLLRVFDLLDDAIALDSRDIEVDKLLRTLAEA